MFRSKNVQYVSAIDKMLDEFNETHEKSPAQQAEIDKYSCIHRLRDESQNSESDKAKS